MTAAILSCHSVTNEPLARLTAQNKWEYSARHGYDLITMRCDWELWKLTMLPRILQFLAIYDVVLSVGSDVIFTNHSIRIEDRLTEQDHVVLAKEGLGDPKEGWSLINNDVVLWRNTPETISLLKKLIVGMEVWSGCSQMWQWYLAELLFGEGKDEETIKTVRLVEPRVMNAHWLPGPEGKNQWQMGDWIFHAVCGSNQQKFEQCAQYLKMAG